jgi:hypothetical protein
MDVLHEMEDQFGISLAQVRIHNDTVAAQAALALHADAFTVGCDIFFAQNAYAPDSRASRKLLAHELTHAVQALRGEIGASHTKIRISQPEESLERKAESFAERIDRDHGRDDQHLLERSSQPDPWRGDAPPPRRHAIEEVGCQPASKAIAKGKQLAIHDERAPNEIAHSAVERIGDIPVSRVSGASATIFRTHER